MSRWIRLRTLRDTLKDRYADQASLDELDTQLSDALPDAVAHAGRLANFYRTHAEAIDALVANAAADRPSGRMSRMIAVDGAGFAASAESRARSLAERDQPAGDPATETFCDYLATAGSEADVTCISTGDKYDCAYATLVALLSDQYC